MGIRERDKAGKNEGKRGEDAVEEAGAPAGHLEPIFRLLLLIAFRRKTTLPA